MPDLNRPVADDFAYPKVPVELRPLFLHVLDAVTDAMREPGHAASIPEAALRNDIRRLFEAYEAPVKPCDGPDYGPQARMSQQYADADGYLRGITRIVNTVTGELVPLPSPIDVHLRDIDRVVDEYQARFLAEWEAGAEERARQSGSVFGIEVQR